MGGWRKNRAPREAVELNLLQDPAGIESVLGEKVALIYKHSPICWISKRALDQVEDFARSRPDVPVYFLDVVQNQALSWEVADRIGVPHESPQVILLQEGASSWSASHGGVKASSIVAQIERAG